jgi:hypothetical protein
MAPPVALAGAPKLLRQMIRGLTYSFPCPRLLNGRQRPCSVLALCTIESSGAVALCLPYHLISWITIRKPVKSLDLWCLLKCCKTVADRADVGSGNLHYVAACQVPLGLHLLPYTARGASRLSGSTAVFSLRSIHAASGEWARRHAQAGFDMVAVGTDALARCSPPKIGYSWRRTSHGRTRSGSFIENSTVAVVLADVPLIVVSGEGVRIERWGVLYGFLVVAQCHRAGGFLIHVFEGNQVVLPAEA